jgi:SAM-dependent methyltransferase
MIRKPSILKFFENLMPKVPRLDRPELNLGVFERYTDKLPSHQNAVDAVPGWSTSLPHEFQVKAGQMDAFNDARIAWAGECFGDLTDKNVLELGPLEAGHTMHLERLGANVLAIEANKYAFLRCLIFKEIVNLRKSRFLLGDFVKWLEVSGDQFDLIVASGVLYHMQDPLHLLDLISRHSRSLFLWTHYVSEEAMPVGDPRRAVLSTNPKLVSFHGAQIRLYQRTYSNADSNIDFNGGLIDDHSWIHRDDIPAALSVLGYDDIRTSHDQPNHVNGPAISIFARKSSYNS